VKKKLMHIIKYAVGTASFAGAPFINHQVLSEKDLLPKRLKKLDAAVVTRF
jgi:ribonucleoside-diphosphate reductase alpha chain